MLYADRYVMINPFARVANKINWRFGREFECNGHNAVNFQSVIKPGMIMLSHKKYELTNLFIKGYWTHTAIITSDKYVVEATSKGVEKKTLDQILAKTDDFIILKPLFADEYTMLKASRYVLGVVGYPYNFSFRQYSKSFYCSELVYWAYARSCSMTGADNKYFHTITSFLDGRIIIPQHFTESSDLWEAVEY